MYRYEGIARKCVTADDVALINAMPEGWWPLQSLVDMTGSPRQTLRKVLERQSHTGVIEIKEDDTWYLKTKRTRFVYRRTGQEPQPYTPKPSVYRRERKAKPYRDRRIGTIPPHPHRRSSPCEPTRNLSKPTGDGMCRISSDWHR
jgi:hypothetical protein